MYCVKCGAQSAENATFCKHCGAELRRPTPLRPEAPPAATGPIGVAPAPAPAYPVAPPAVAPVPAEDGVRYGGFWRRVFAALVDGVIATVLWLALGTAFEYAAAAWLGGHEFAPDGQQLMASLSAISIGRTALAWVVVLGYFALLEATPLRATPGKALLGLRVTKLDGKRVGIIRSITRNALKGLSAAMLMLGFAMAGFTKRKQALHDLMTRSLVVRR